ncbi:uncharacterized protein PAC_18683 [Phialocephala subalpina]|uniref:Uncharacterized protein n=1 Tax=Phialocephala subalpina TaxID=576137 RepID=A0A1L7XUS8_9HELO|nr:uncharacterized protein PAC_18683 [Phialocephala subalpina]
MNGSTVAVNRSIIYAIHPTIKTEVIELPMQDPGPGEVLIRLETCCPFGIVSGYLTYMTPGTFTTLHRRSTSHQFQMISINQAGDADAPEAIKSGNRLDAKE